MPYSFLDGNSTNDSENVAHVMSNQRHFLLDSGLAFAVTVFIYIDLN